MTWLSPDWVLGPETLLFSASILVHREYLFSLVPFDESDEPASWLDAKTVCVREDYQYPALTPYFDKGVAQAVRVSSQVAPVNLLLRGRCDLLYMNEMRAAWMMRNLGLEGQIWRSKYPVDQVALSLVFSEKWQDKMSQVNQALAKIKSSGELNAILQSNVHSDQLVELLIH